MTSLPLEKQRKEVKEMNTLVIVLIAAVCLFGAYTLYGRWLANKWGIDPSAKTPAVVHEDGRDYVPTDGWTVFAHQFSSIAGAGPVTGAIQAAAFGWLPVLLWVLLGGIIGALVAIGNFAGICFVVQKVIDEPDEKKRKAQLQISYNTRMLLQALWIIIAIAAPCFQAFAGVLPLLFPRVTIYYLQITGKYKPLTPPQEPVDIAVEDDPAPAKASAVQPRDEGGEQE